jgi:mannose-6-phosphate isomerase-like protein (cupin superfamily)
MRALRDGRTLVYDQEPPPPEGTRPATEAVVGGEGFQADGITLLADIEEIAVADTWSELAGPPAPHVHARHIESFYVLKGELTITVDDREHRAGPGTWVQVPVGAAHAVSALAPARFVNLHTPSCGVGAFLRALQETGDEERAAAGAGFDQQPAR